jgi:transcriptional regulator with XRE-family HTH domain
MADPTGRSVSDLGVRLRRLRTDRSLSVREVARRAGCSPSLVSQVERGVVAPSAQTVYAIANVLGVSLDHLFGDRFDQPVTPPTARPAPDVPPAAAAGGPPWGRATGPAGEGLVQRADSRERINLAGGLRWDRLTPRHDPRVDFLEVVYQPGSTSSPDGQSVRHGGREYLVVLEGQLQAQVGEQVFVLDVGDSLAFDATVEHEYQNVSSEPSRHVSVVVHDL